MNGTFKNYLYHALGGIILSGLGLLVGLFALELPMYKSMFVGFWTSFVWYYAHEVTDMEYALPGAARHNVLESINFFKWSVDGKLDLMSAIAIPGLVTGALYLDKVL